MLFNLPPGDWAAGERGLACLPDRHSEFAEGVEQALNYAMLLDCERVHCMAGLRPWGVTEEELEANYVANLRFAADRFATVGATVMIEPINSRIDMPGYWLDDIDKALRLIETIDRSQRQAATRPLPRADHPGRSGAHHRGKHRPDRPCADRRQPGPPRAG